MTSRRPPRAIDAITFAAPENEIVLLDEDGTPVGTADSASSHHADTPLHLGFWVHVFDELGRVLLIRRALTWPMWPGVWTNSYSGHPRPHEPFTVAVARCVHEQFGLHITDLSLQLEDFRVRAVDAGGMLENEMGPVFAATATGTVSPDVAEIMEFVWVEPGTLAAAAGLLPQVFSPWAATQFALLGDRWTRARNINEEPSE